MNDLWPELDVLEENQQEENNALQILRDQARFLGKKSKNKVRATFSKVSYRELPSGFSALNAITTITAIGQVKKEEVLEEDLASKENVADVLKEQPYKFEIYSEKYRYRLFVYTYSPIYPNKILIDEGIAKEIDEPQETDIESDQELMELLTSIYSSQRVTRIIRMMVIEADKDEKEK